GRSGLPQFGPGAAELEPRVRAAGGAHRVGRLLGIAGIQIQLRPGERLAVRVEHPAADHHGASLLLRLARLLLRRPRRGRGGGLVAPRGLGGAGRGPRPPFPWGGLAGPAPPPRPKPCPPAARRRSSVWLSP